MILITDIGKDIDDAVALIYAIVSGIPLKTVITTSKDAVDSAKICQNIIDNLSERYPLARKIEVLIGSTSPLKSGITHPNIYKGPFSKSNISIKQLDPLKIQGGDAIVIGPLTDLSKLMENEKVKRVLYMAQAKKDQGSLIPDLSAYNLRCDPFASETCFQFQDNIPFGFIGKNLAYQVPFSEQDFERMAATGHPVGEFLQDHALTSFDFFKNNCPDLYDRIYKGTGNLSYCYDPLTILATKHPELFTFEKFGKHRIGVGIEAEKAKNILLDTVEKGLS